MKKRLFKFVAARSAVALIAAMGYASVYGCPEGSEATHVCHDCPGARTTELARVRSGGFVKRGYYATLLARVDDPAVWQTGIDDGNIIIIPETSGSYDPGTPKELKGFGNRKVSYGAREMTVTMNDPDYYENYAFWNEIVDRTDLIPFFRTSSLVHLFDTEATIVGSDPIVDDLEEVITWVGNIKVVSKNLPSKHLLEPIADIFTCATF